jgi:hypothetical protein
MGLDGIGEVGNRANEEQSGIYRAIFLVSLAGTGWGAGWKEKD